MTKGVWKVFVASSNYGSFFNMPMVLTILSLIVFSVMNYYSNY